MKTLALGQVETIGLPPAIAAADAAVKSADVYLVGYELAKGGGKVTIKVVGQVGAVKAAVAAAKMAATRIGMVATSSVIARPSDQIEKLIHSADTVGVETVEAVQESPLTPADEPAADTVVAVDEAPQDHTEENEAIVLGSDQGEET
ncbi:MAG: BMC domain-containing protein [Arachnia sp.]